MVVYHTRYRKDWQGQWCVSDVHHTTSGSTDWFQLTLSVNTTPIFHTWYLVSMELSLKQNTLL